MVPPGERTHGPVRQEDVTQPLAYGALESVYAGTPGLSVDKLKAVIGTAWGALSNEDTRGTVFACDEAQNLDDRSSTNEYPLSLLLDAFQSLQRQGLPVLLVLSGLPALVGKLAAARTYTERMFQIVELGGLSEMASREAILRPIADADSIFLNEESVDTVVRLAGGYPYFIQFISREIYDVFIRRLDRGGSAVIPVAEITRKLTQTRRGLLRWTVGASHRPATGPDDGRGPCCRDGEFTIQDPVDKSADVLDKPISGSHANQILNPLGEQGMTFKHRRDRCSPTSFGGRPARSRIACSNACGETRRNRACAQVC